jgi:chromosome segregation protein
MKLYDNILSLKEKILNINTNIEVLNKELEKENNDNKELEKRLRSVIENLEKTLNNKNNITSELNISVRNITELKHRKEVLINSIENNSSLPYGTKNVLNNIKLTGIHNVVGKLFETEEKYSTAIDIALALASSHIICDNENNAKEAIEYLKSNNLGRATFLPLNVIKPRSIDNDIYNEIKGENGFIDIASNLIKFDLKYKNIMLNLLGTVIVCSDITSANKIARKINNRYKIVTLSGEVVNIGGSITGGTVKKSSIISDKYELENVIKKIDSKQSEINELENKINEIDELYSNYDDKRRSILLNVETNSNILKEKTNKLEELLIEKSSLETEIKANENIINNVVSDEEEKVLNEYYETIKKKDTLNIEIEEILKKLEREKDDLVNNETSAKSNNHEFTKLQNELKEHEIKISRLDVKLDNLLNILSEEYSITYEKAKENYILDINEDEARKIVNKLKSEIKSLGNVNIGSIEEYERVSERYEFLIKQKEDLSNAEDMLLEIISEMDEVMKEKFDETFKVVQVHFKEIFRKLFGGGSAELKLTNPNDLLETGIEIVALPPGKKLQHISLLSGGEKTLTAISLLFAILKTRPVPFCILDEVEAALDEANVDNFGRFLKEFKGDTQFIIITHKKKTMEYADILYGITMQESGVSKLVSVKLEELK